MLKNFLKEAGCLNEYDKNVVKKRAAIQKAVHHNAHFYGVGSFLRVFAAIFYGANDNSH